MPPPLRLRPREGPAEVDIVTFGENSLDFVGRYQTSRPGKTKRALDSFDLHVGGQTATAAAACARLGLRTRYVGSFGTDEWGGRVRRALGGLGVDVRAIERPGVQSRVAVVLVDQTGERTVLEYRHPGLELEPANLSLETLVAGRVLLVDGTSPRAALAAAQYARRMAVPTLVDVDTVTPEICALLQAIDIIIVPEPFVGEWSGRSDLGAGLRAMAAEFSSASAIIATRGPAGSIALAGETEVHTPGYAVAVVDTTGAGDAFRGGFAAAWVRSAGRGPIADLLRFANATAALNCRAVGAQTSLPDLDDVNRLVTGAARDRSN